jgi:hypothetical protein
VLALGLAGLVLLWRRDRLLCAALSLAFVAQTFVNGSIYTWHLSHSFGFRRLIECSPIVILGLALLFDRWQRTWIGSARLAPLALSLVLIAWNVGLVANWTVIHPELRQGLLWRDLPRWQLEVPGQIVSKLNLLIFDRCKLYQNQGCGN